MAKNKKRKEQGGGQQFLSPEQYLKQRARTLPIGKCYINDDADKAGMAQIIVTRKHTGGRISAAAFLVDLQCLGVKDTYYRLRMEEEELDELMERQPLDWRECSYDEAHNRIYGAISFAEEGGIEPHKGFRLTQNMLEEDNDDVPLIEYDYGKDGKHFLVCHSNLEASRYLPTLRKHLGDNFDYLINDQERDEYFDEDEDDDDEPVYIADCIADLEADDLHFMAFGLGIELDINASIEKQRKQYVKEILKDPKDVLMRLPNEDLTMLEELANESKEDRILFYPNKSIEPLMYHYGLIDYDDEDIECRFYRVAEDFWKAARPLLKEVENEEANKTRLAVEGIVSGLVNLYGTINLKDTKYYLATLLNMTEEDTKDLFDIVLGHSALLPYLLHTTTSDTDAIRQSYDTNMAFSSRFGWDSESKLYEAIAQRAHTIPDRRDFSVEVIFFAGASIPIIPNEHQKDFTQYLCAQLGYDEDQTLLLRHNLWLRAQHEDNPDNPYGSYLDFFTKEIIGRAPKKPQMKVINEGMQALQTYMNAMPRWILKGYTPEQISSK